jgi:hypothetical protein
MPQSSETIYVRVGGGLSALAHSIGGHSEARLHRLLLGPRKISFNRAPAKNRDPKGDFRAPDAPQLEEIALTGLRQLSPQVAPALLSKVRAELTSWQAHLVDTLKRS